MRIRALELARREFATDRRSAPRPSDSTALGPLRRSLESGLFVRRVAYLGDDPLHRLVEVLLFQLALPNGDGCPAKFRELINSGLVALDVSLELCDPKIRIALGYRWIAVGTAVPKAAVNKNGDLAAGESDVGPAGRFFPLQAIAGEAGFAQALTNQQLGLGVRALVALHGFTAVPSALNLLFVALGIAGFG